MKIIVKKSYSLRHLAQTGYPKKGQFLKIFLKPPLNYHEKCRWKEALGFWKLYCTLGHVIRLRLLTFERNKHLQSFSFTNNFHITKVPHQDKQSRENERGERER